MPEKPVELLSYDDLHQPLSPLFLDYLSGREGSRPFLGPGGADLAAIAEGAERAGALQRPMEAVAGALARQQEARGAARAAERARALAEPGATAIVTGQQAGLFGGPLFVLWKALTTIKVAELLENERGRPVVPVFWVASDDHDFAEIRSTSVIDAAGTIRGLRYAPRHEPIGQPAWAVALDDTIPALVEELAQALPPALGRDETLAVVARCYRPGVTLSEAFGGLLSSLMPGLVVLEPADPALKRLMVPVLARELREGSPTSRLALEAGRALLAAGYHQQVPVRPGFLNLFAVVEGQRRALALADGTVEVRGTRERWPVEEALRRLEADPGPWSPGALLRPLAQDALLPTAAYVGGPAEIAYHAQITPSYAHFGIPRPALLPRPSLTLVEPPQARALDAERLSLGDLVGDPEALVARWAQEAYPDVEGAFARTREAIEREMGRVEEALSAHDPTLGAATASARGRALHQVEGLHEKALRALKKRDQGRAERLRRTRDALVPGGSLQERGLGLVGALGRHGTPLLADLQGRLDPFARGHQVVRL
ncbi:MAG TPA: bacillithiol biosynthesis cysteine-adding enzyme BshC [Vicinamibacteria bacterium]|nr:bacillithiol biosynthesis cysteine-adding enzyme BshC [Vicinamibacteria bacterium]